MPLNVALHQSLQNVSEFDQEIPQPLTKVESTTSWGRVTEYRYPGGGSRISGKGIHDLIHMYKNEGIRFDDFVSFFLNIP